MKIRVVVILTTFGSVLFLAPHTQSAAQARPGGPPKVFCQPPIATDMKLMRDSVNDVAPTLKLRGFTDTDVDGALTWTTMDFRCGLRAISSARDIPKDAFIASVRSRGRLLVDSTPSHALVQIDGQPWGEPTNTKGFPEVGVHRIRLTLDGMEAVEQPCEVYKDSITHFTATLKKVGSSALCSKE
jgi:PEGA domain